MAQKGVYLSIELDDQGTATVKNFEEKYKKAMDQVKSSSQQASSSLDGSFKKIGNAFNKLKSHWVGLTAVAAGATYAIQRVARSSISAASDLEEVSNKFDVVFAGMGKQAQDWSKNLVESYAMSTRESKQYLSSIQDLLVPMGMQKKAAGELSYEIVKLSADLGSFNNQKTAKVMDDVQSALVGNYETMKKYGVVINAAYVQQKALNMGLAATKDELTAADKAQAAYQLILESSTAAIGDMARTSEDYANQNKQLNANIEELYSTIGTHLLPAATDITKEINKWIKVNKDLIGIKVKDWVETITNKMKGFYEVAKDLNDLYDKIPKGGLIGAIIGLKVGGPWGAAAGFVIGDITANLKEYKKNLMGLFGGYGVNWEEALSNINQPIGETDEKIKKLTKTMDTASTVIKENTKNLEDNANTHGKVTGIIKKSSEVMDEHVKLYKEWNKQLEKINEEQKRLQEERIAAEEDALNDLLRANIEITDDLAEKIRFYAEQDPKLLKFFQEYLMEKQREEQKALEKTKDVLGDEAEAHQDTYQSIAGFYREALMQMGDDTSSFINLVLAKLKNLAASVAAEALTSVTMSVLGKIPGIAAKEAAPAEKTGEEAGEGAAKAAGGIASMTGGPIGWAVTGGMIGYSVLKSVLDKQKEDERKRKMRAEEYQRQLEIAAASSAQTWDEWFEGSEKLLSEKYAYAAVKYGGLDDQGLKENLFKVAEIGREYKQAVEEHGDASMQAIKSYHELGMQMEVFGAQSRAWSKEGQKMAEQWEQIWEKTKQIQVNEILDDINRNIGSFIINLSKLDFLEMEEAQRATIKYEQTLRFLTDDTLKALNGELTKARELFKEAAIEVDNLARSEEELAIKTQILRSEMELTEGQLMALRIGEVNVEMIKFYEALGWTDKELELVSVSAEEAKTGFEKMEESAKNLTENLETMAEQFRIFDQVNEDLQEVYNNLVKVSVGMEMVAQAGQKLQAVPDSLENIKKGLEAGDLQAVNREIQNLTNTFMYLSAVLEQLGAVKLAQVAFAFGELGAAIMIVITLVQNLESAFTSLLAKNDEMADKYEQFLKNLKERFPKIYEKIGEHLEGLIPVTPEPTIGTIGNVLGIGKMSIGEAASVYRKYTEKPMGEEAAMRKEVGAAIDALVAFREAEKKRLAEGGFTQAELDYLQSISQAVVDLNEGLKDAIDKLKAERRERAKQFMKPFEDIISTQGMTEYEKQVYNINRQYDDAAESLKKMNLEVADYVEMEGKLNLARKIELENLAKAQEQMIRDYWEPVIESIKNDMMALKYSTFNLAPPAERARSAQEEYQRLKLAMQSATGEDFVKAYEAYKGFYGTYLKEMQGTYKSSSKYLEAYEDVMKTLGEAEVKARQEEVSALSQFEFQSLNKQNVLIDINRDIETELGEIKNLNANLPENYDALKTSTEAVSDRLKEIKEADVVNLQEYKLHQDLLAIKRDEILNQTVNLQAENNRMAEERKEILIVIKNLLEDVKGNTRETARISQAKRSSTQSEALR